MAAALVAGPVVDPTGWPVRTSTRAELAEVFVAMGMPALGYFLDSAVERDGQWQLCFDYGDMLAAQQGNVGRWWADWAAVGCPTLLLRGGQSPILSARHAADMVRRRPGTEFVELPGCGHWLHRDDLAGFALASRTFLNKHGQWRHGGAI